MTSYKGPDLSGFTSGGNFHDGCVRVYNSLEEWKKPLLHKALLRIIRHQEKDSLQVICGLLLRAANECQGRRHYAFTVVIDCSVTDADLGVPMIQNGDDLNSRHHHCNMLFRAAQDPIDELKEKAFRSIFLEPTKMYYRAVGDENNELSVDVHGSNTYLALLLAALGVKLSQAPLLPDGIGGIAQFIEALNNSDMELLWNPKNIGESWSTVFKTQQPSRLQKRVEPNMFYFSGNTPLVKAQESLKSINSPSRTLFIPYLDAFAKFFSEQFVVDWICRNFLANDSLQGSLNFLFQKIASPEEVNKADGEARQWLWDIMSGEFQFANGLALLQFCGICIRPEAKGKV